MVNWDLQASQHYQTKKSFTKTNSKLYYVKYYLTDNSGYVIATTRPETILADTAVAVNPTMIDTTFN